jgi:glycosyltransferase involved in cell wall biosynthesis
LGALPVDISGLSLEPAFTEAGAWPILAAMEERKDQPVAELEIRPPASIVVGKGNAFVIAGYCYHPLERTKELAIEVGDARQEVEHLRLPRADVYDRLDSGDPARPQAYRSGFVAVLDLSPVDGEERLELSALLKLEGGREVRVPLGDIVASAELTVPPEAAEARFPDTGGPRVAICMATYNPPEALLHRQLDSIREQTHGNWVCLISDDSSRPEYFEKLASAIEGDPRFVLSPGEERLGFYGNFERAMSMAPPSADFVTLCDQDDYWYPEKLQRLLAAIGDAQLAYSDTRIVNPAGEVLQPSFWTVRNTNYTNFGSLLLANSVPGAASLFRRDLLEDVLPLPPKFANAYHDYWLALVAMARGRIEYVEAPLYDYVQHDDAVIGHAAANKPRRALRLHLLDRLRNPSDAALVAYYFKWHHHVHFAEVLRLRCWDAMSGAKRRTLRRLLNADRGFVGIPWLLARRTRRLWGRQETLDRELAYAYALTRRRAMSALNFGRTRPPRVLSRDASIPTPPPYD